MKILILDIDSKIPNLALKKIEKYHQSQGDEITWNMPLYAHMADKIYASCIFERSREKAIQWEGRALIGGSGYDISIKLPPEIETIKPRINLGFTTRGCIRKCEFCIVPEKEGRIKIEGDLLDLWDGKAKDITLLDNNILAAPKHFKEICNQARENKIRLDFNQGLDYRLLNQAMVDELKTIRHQELHFAWDNFDEQPGIDKVIDMLQDNKINRCTWLVLAGFNTDFQQDLYRVSHLKARNQNAYLMRYNGQTTKELTRLSRWVNNRSWFQALTWDEFIKRNYPK